MKRIMINIVTILILIFCSTSLIACSEKDITGSCKLTKDYENKDFVTNGIGEATLANTTDGDTTGFYLKTGGYVIIRYYGIDTPESTKDYDKWGKSASIYNAEILNKATKIVLEATTTPASVDSYGSRYLGYVWYQTEENQEFRMLNLETVEVGYSENKILEEDNDYKSYFVSAEKAAKKAKLHIWSEDEDPYYSEEILDINLKQLNESPKEYYDSYKFVRFDAYIKNVAAGYIYIANIIDGVEYSFVIYNNMNSLASLFASGNLLKFVGRVLIYDGNYQVTALKYDWLAETDDTCKLLTRGYCLQFNENNISGNSLSELTVKKASVENNTLKIEGVATNEDNKEVNVVLTCNIGNEKVNANDYLDKKISVKNAYCEEGYKKASTDIQVNVLSFSNISIK